MTGEKRDTKTPTEQHKAEIKEEIKVVITSPTAINQPETKTGVSNLEIKTPYTVQRLDKGSVALKHVSEETSDARANS